MRVLDSNSWLSILHNPDKNQAFSPLQLSNSHVRKWELAEHLLHRVYSAFDTLFPSLLFTLAGTLSRAHTQIGKRV